MSWSTNYKASDFNLRELYSLRGGFWYATTGQGTLLLIAKDNYVSEGQGGYFSKNWRIFTSWTFGMDSEISKGEYLIKRRTLRQCLIWIKNEMSTIPYYTRTQYFANKIYDSSAGIDSGEYKACEYELESIKNIRAGYWKAESKTLGKFEIKKTKRMSGSLGYDPKRCWFLRHEENLNLDCERGTLKECLLHITNLQRENEIIKESMREQDSFDRWCIENDIAHCDRCIDLNKTFNFSNCCGCIAYNNFRASEKFRYKGENK